MNTFAQQKVEAGNWSSSLLTLLLIQLFTWKAVLIETPTFRWMNDLNTH